MCCNRGEILSQAQLLDGSDTDLQICNCTGSGTYLPRVVSPSDEEIAKLTDKESELSPRPSCVVNVHTHDGLVNYYSGP